MASAVVWADVVALGHRAARAFKLTRRKRLRFEPMPTNRKTVHDGDCAPYAGLIRLRLHRIGRPSQPLSRSSIMAALAHELAHLAGKDRLGRMGYDHGAEHGELTRRIAQWLREQGQPVGHKLHTGVARSRRRKRAPKFRRAWKRPKARA